MKTFYLAGPINGCTDAEANDWRAEAKQRLVGYSWLDPMSRDYRGRELEPGIAQEIVHGDKTDIKSCDGMLIYFEKPSVGTSMEVLYAWERGIPAVVVNKSGKPLSPWMIYHTIAQVKTIKQAVDKLLCGQWPVRSINVYTYQFKSKCPVNDKTIKYTLEIETDGSEIMVEELQAFVKKCGNALHEDLAKWLFKEFGGHQTLIAKHHGTDIKTVRG